MSSRPTAPAQLPPSGITGLDPAWSRLVVAPDAGGVGRTWHLLDSHAGAPDPPRPLLTLLCVHGNPSWSFLWRSVLAGVASDDVRVIAVDQLDMGFSERTGQKRTLATRVDDLHHLTTTLGLTGLVVTVAHDWGGPVSLGWALRHVDTNPVTGPRLAGVVLTNTAVHQPPTSPAPAVIRLIRSRPMLRPTTVNTLAFIRGAYEMSRPRLPEAVRKGFVAPYLERDRRTAIADFVADIPLDPAHESASTLDAIAAGLSELADIPTLLLWGPRDHVFGDLYLHDLESRLPHAQVHRFPQASHFVMEDADVAGAVSAWLPTLNPATTADLGSDRRPRRALADFSTFDPETPAVVEMADDRLGPEDRDEGRPPGIARSISFGQLAGRVEQLAAGMATHGIAPGDRVAVMIPPGIDLSLAVYACWRLGATLVLVDSGLGPKGMQQALRSADPDHLIGIDKALAAARAMRWPGRRIAVAPRSTPVTSALGITTDLEALESSGGPTPPHPDPDAFAAIAFTSGATGPSKGVVYRHHQIQAQRDALVDLYGLTSDDRLVAAFAPFALYGPTMGLTSVVPDMDVTAPGTLTADALGEAVAAVDATLVFASPAALVNTITTADALQPSHHAAFGRVRLLLSAGAPVRPELLRSACEFFPNASAHTPYGMTETLPVADISLAEIDEASSHGGDGVCVGQPLPTVDVMIDPLDSIGEPVGMATTDPDVLGEIIVKAPHAREGYDRLWFTEHRASQPRGWHRTGDVGRLDDVGRLWVGGRLGHVITTPDGPIAPVRHEQQLERLPDVGAAAVIGVGPSGTQAVVAVVETSGRHPTGQASLDLISRARRAVGDHVDLAAVLVVDSLPVDRRHNSKIDRTAIATWAGRTLAGESAGSL